jgi:peptidoglycan biosynthesis protein MviN/MurJ (putative lipid II flippase)
VLNFVLIPPFGIAGLASAIAIMSWLNCLMLTSSCTGADISGSRMARLRVSRQLLPAR